MTPQDLTRKLNDYVISSLEELGEGDEFQSARSPCLNAMVKMVKESIGNGLPISGPVVEALRTLEEGAALQKQAQAALHLGDLDAAHRFTFKLSRSFGDVTRTD